MKIVLTFIAAWIVGVAISFGLDQLMEAWTGNPSPGPNVIAIGFGLTIGMVVVHKLKRQQPPA